MRLITALLTFLVLSGVAGAQLVVDKNSIDLEIHPGEVTIRTITLKNTGIEPIYDVTITPVGGNARDMLFIEKTYIRKIDTEDSDLDDNKVKVPIICIAAPEIPPGDYSGYIYIFDTVMPRVPIVVAINIKVTKQESYGLSLTIDDASSAKAEIQPDEGGEFTLTVRNTGRFRDVVSLDIPEIPQGWEIELLDGEGPVSLPHEMAISADSSRDLILALGFTDEAREGSMEVTATSLGNSSVNDTVSVNIKLGVAVRAYDVAIDIPDRIITNKTYTGTIAILLEKEELVQVEMFSNESFLIVPSSITVPVTANKPGSGNFSFIAIHPGTYPVLFKMKDTHGIPLPPEIVVTTAISPNGTVVLTSEDILYRSLAASTALVNDSLPVMYIGRSLTDEDRDTLLTFDRVVILGDEAQVSREVEKQLSRNMNVTRIDGADICQTSWEFLHEVWINDTQKVIISGDNDVEIFKAYQKATELSLPMVVCSSPPGEDIKPLIEDLKSRGLEGIILIETTAPLEESWRSLGLFTEVA